MSILFEIFGSGLVWSKAALKLVLLASDAVALKVNVAESPEASEGVDQVMDCPDSVPPPESEAPVNELENIAVRLAFSDAAGPVFATEIVQVTVVPTRTVDGQLSATKESASTGATVNDCCTCGAGL